MPSGSRGIRRVRGGIISDVNPRIGMVIVASIDYRSSKASLQARLYASMVWDQQVRELVNSPASSHRLGRGPACAYQHVPLG